MLRAKRVPVQLPTVPMNSIRCVALTRGHDWKQFHTRALATKSKSLFLQADPRLWPGTKTAQATSAFLLPKARLTGRDDPDPQRRDRTLNLVLFSSLQSRHGTLGQSARQF